MHAYKVFYNEEIEEIRVVFEALDNPEDFKFVDIIQHDNANQTAQQLKMKAVSAVGKQFRILELDLNKNVKIYDVEPRGTYRMPDKAKVEPEEVGREPTEDTEEDKEQPNEVVLTSNLETALKVGQSYKITSDTEAELAYESSNKDVATVTKGGNVKAVGAGEAIIRTVLKDNLDVYADTTVKVEEEVKAEEPNEEKPASEEAPKTEGVKEEQK